MTATVPLWGLAPFVVMLLSIAVLPLVGATAHWWESPRHQLLVSCVLGLPVAAWMAHLFGGELVAESVWEYVSFIVLLAALYTVSGGIHLSGDLRATPRNNTALLALGGLLASVIGTTGASMLLIRPVLRANQERRHVVHTVVFFIFVVSNCGGLLTPLGDPPLFLGFLRGVPFAWTLHLFGPWLLVNALLLATYWAIDARSHAAETADDLALDDSSAEPLRLHGASNIAWLVVVVAGVALLPSLDVAGAWSGHAPWHALVPWRELVLVGAALASLRLGDCDARYRGNHFTWGPMAEVAALFVGIFLTMIPALRVLEELAPSLRLGNVTFFLATGGLSSVLDNAPTYATFFEVARTMGGAGPLVAGVPVGHLEAISLGAVCCGAMTYVGNGPNLMVKSVAEHAGVTMPQFGGYVLHALRFLAPALAAMVLVFLTGGAWRWAGVALIVALLVRAWRLRTGGGVQPASAGPLHLDD